MNFFLCNRCNKRSEDNLLNINSTEILLNSNPHNLINANNINKIDSIEQAEQFPNINIGENIQTSINNVNNLEKDQEDELEIIEYPYSKKEKKIPNKIKPKQFTNNKSKFNSSNLIEQNIINRLNKSGKKTSSNTNSNKGLAYKINNIKQKKLSGRKVKDIEINDDDFERKDTMTDPANMALTSLIQDINKNKMSKGKKLQKIINNNTDNEDDIITIKDETENNYFIINNDESIVDFRNDNKNNNKNKDIKKLDNNISNKANNIIKREVGNKNKICINRKNKKSINSYNAVKKNDNYMNKINEKKLFQNKKISEYNNNIIQKKKLLKNKEDLMNENNSKMNSLSYSTKKQFPKSFSFNSFKNERKFNVSNFNKGKNNNDFGYSLTLSKKYNKIFKNIFKHIDSEEIWSLKKSEKNKNKTKIAHKNVQRAQIPIQKALSSHIALYH